MVKKLFTYIFIYTLLVGCDTQNPLSNNICESDCFLDIEAPSLQIDDNGYYHIEWLEGYIQTFSTLDANTGSNEIQKVYWSTECQHRISSPVPDILLPASVSCVNPASYTDDGIAHTVLAVWEEMIGDTIIVYAGYNDECGVEYIDSIRIIIEDEIQN